MGRSALRDTTVVGVGVALLVIAGWVYLVVSAGRMHALAAGEMPGMEMVSMPAALAAPQLQTWSLLDLLTLFTMWTIMMVAMMLPSATPMIALFAGVSRRRRESAQPWVPTAVFVAGYIVLWTLYSAIAALAQWGLHRSALLSPMMVAASAPLGGGLLIAAGAYQFTPLKRACIAHCRTPLAFLSAHWREGITGALRLGMTHGTHCIGCCAILMAILFVGGVMNLLWIAAISVFVLLEKILPRGESFGRAAGFVLIGWGAWIVIGGA